METYLFHPTYYPVFEAETYIQTKDVFFEYTDYLLQTTFITPFRLVRSIWFDNYEQTTTFGHN